MTTCRFDGCQRKPVYPDQQRCEIHRLRWAEPVEVREPAWRRWTREHRNAKDLSAA